MTPHGPTSDVPKSMDQALRLPIVLLLISGGTILFDLVAACSLLALLFRVVFNVPLLDTWDVVVRFGGAVVLATPLVGLLIGAIMLLKRRPAGRSILVVHYWIMLVVCVLGLLALITNPHVSPGISLQQLVVLTIVVGLMMAMLICLYSKSVRVVLCSQKQLDRWVAATCILPPCLIAIPITFLAGSVLASNAWVWVVRPNFDRVGGLRLVFQTDMRDDPADFQVDQVVQAVQRRLDPWSSAGVRVRALGPDRIEVLCPQLTDPERIRRVKDRITRLGMLEFRILANEKHDGATGNDAIRLAREKFSGDADLKITVQAQAYEWLKIQDADAFDLQGSTPMESVAVADGFVLTLVPDEAMRVRGDELTRCEPTQSAQLRPAIGFHLNSTGTRKFAALTRSYQPELDGTRFRLAIILDHQVMSAPRINSPIEQGEGIIEGNFTPQEVDNLLAILNAATLPVPLLPEPLEEQYISPTR